MFSVKEIQCVLWAYLSVSFGKNQMDSDCGVILPIHYMQTLYKDEFHC